MTRIKLLELCFKWLDLLIAIKDTGLSYEVQRDHIKSMLNVGNEEWISKKRLREITKESKYLFLYLFQLDKRLSSELGQQIVGKIFPETRRKEIYTRDLEHRGRIIQSEINYLINKPAVKQESVGA